VDEDFNPEQPDKLPAEDFKDPLPLASGEDDTPEILAGLDSAAQELDSALPPEEPPPPAEEPPPVPAVDVADLNLGETYPDDDLSGVDLSEEVPPSEVPELKHLDEATASLEEFGNDLNDFNDAGGADNSIPNIGSGDDSSRDGAEQLMDSDFENRSQMKEMLIEHARRLDEMTRFLEDERL
jgi:hypothetical protein